MISDERIDEHLDTTDLLTLERRIGEAAVAAGVELVRVAEVRGTYAAIFNVKPNLTYTKGFGTRWYNDQSELLSTVLDTLEHLRFDKETVDMNIFSADMFEYLSAEMLPTDGRGISLTVKSVVQEVIAGPRGEDMKVTVSFVERPKKLILNKTNARAIAKALGPETDNWRGASLMLGVEIVKVGRNSVPSVRVKSATAPQQRPNGNGRQQQPPPPADPADPTGQPGLGLQTDMAQGPGAFQD